MESGHRLVTAYGGFTPYAAVQAQSFRTPSYSETDLNGGGFALAYNSRTGTDTEGPTSALSVPGWSSRSTPSVRASPR